MSEYTYYYNFQQVVVSVNLNELRHPETVRMGSRRLHCHLVNNLLFDPNFVTPLIIDTPSNHNLFNQYVFKVQPQNTTGDVESLIILRIRIYSEYKTKLTKILIMNANQYWVP